MTRLAFLTGWNWRCLRFTIAFWLKRRQRQWRQLHRLCGKCHIQETEAAEKLLGRFSFANSFLRLYPSEKRTCFQGRMLDFDACSVRTYSETHVKSSGQRVFCVA